MTRSVRNCEKSVNRYFPLHQRCSKTHGPSLFAGEILKIVLKREEFDDKSEYRVCQIISDNLSYINPVTIKNSKKRKLDATIY